MDKFTSKRISELAGVKFKSTPALTEEELALQFDELYELLEQYESAELLEHIAGLDLQQLDEGFWGNIKDAAKGALGVAKDAKDAVKQKIADKAQHVSSSYAKHRDDAKNIRQNKTKNTFLSLMKSDITKYVQKIEAYVKKEFDGKIPSEAARVMDALEKILKNQLAGVK